MRIAIISYGNSNDKKGAFVATHNRIKHLLRYNNFEIEVFLIQVYYNWLVRTLRKSQIRTKETYFIYDGVKYNNFWFNFSLIDYFLRMKLKSQGPFFFLSAQRWKKLLKDYDFISSHSYEAGIVAFSVWKKYRIPFSITWHGSDIHSEPFSNPSVYKRTKILLENATYNFFVSKNLEDVSKKIAKGITKEVLYNGVDTGIFRKYNKSELKLLQEKLGITSNNKNVAFIGDLLSVKNADMLPEIFYNIKAGIGEVSFFIIGDGKLRKLIESECNKLSIKVSFMGNQDPSKIPALINCMDLLLLPSKNEGLPLITLESVACGVPIIGSRVGGISESIGIENTVVLDDNFAENFSKLAIDFLCEKRNVELNPIFNWSKTAEKEANNYQNYERKIYK